MGGPVFSEALIQVEEDIKKTKSNLQVEEAAKRKARKDLTMMSRKRAVDGVSGTSQRDGLRYSDSN